MSSTFAYGLVALFSILAALFLWLAIILQGKEAKIDLDSTKQGIIQNQNSSKQDILAALQKLQDRIEDKLKTEFPNGYILYGVESGRSLVSLPFHTGKIEVSAEWASAVIQIDPQNKLAYISIPNPKWAIQGSAPRITIEGNMMWSGAYTTGKAIPVTTVSISDQPQMYFKVLNDNPDHALCLIGFK